LTLTSVLSLLFLPENSHYVTIYAVLTDLFIFFMTLGLHPSSSTLKKIMRQSTVPLIWKIHCVTKIIIIMF